MLRGYPPRRFDMQRRHVSIFARFLLIVGLLFLAAQTFGQVKLNYSIFFPASHRNSILAAEWAKEVEKRTDGRVQITMFYGGTLTPPDKCYDGVVKGISDLGMSCLSYTMGRFPLSEVLDLPLGSQSGLVASRLVNDFYNKFKPKELDDVKVMYLHGHGPGLLHTKTPVRALEDLKGMKIRATGTSAMIVSALGAAPVAMPMSDSYDALSRGVTQGILCPTESLQGWKLGEVIKYSTQDYGAAYSITFFVVMNKARWNSLPADVQKAIEEINEEWIDKTGNAWDEMDRAGNLFAAGLGDTIIPLAAEENARWAKAVQPIFDQYVEQKTAKGLPAAEALKFCRDRLKELQ
jgi:TRAP-type C4-dicarboxylate transport system substrate-binding protein